MSWWWVTLRYQRGDGDCGGARYAVEAEDEDMAWVEAQKKLMSDRRRSVLRLDEGDVEPLVLDRSAQGLEAHAVALGMSMAAAEGRLR